MLGLTSLVIALAPSCSKDDDPDGGGNGNGSGTSSGVFVDGQKTQLPYAYWFAEGSNMYDSYLNVEFWSFDLNSGKVPNKFSFVAIYWQVPADQKELKTETIAPGDYTVSAAFGTSASMGGWYGDSYNINQYPLVIEKLDNNKFHIYIEEVTVKGEYPNEGDEKVIKIDYTGALKQRPYVDD